jgi:hypothetical protein
MTTFRRSCGRLRTRYTTRHVVREGMKSPCRNRAPTSIGRLSVAAQNRLHPMTTKPPVNRRGRTGKVSTSRPNGRVASAIPKITAETVSEAYDALTPNSDRITGRTGWVM